MFSNMFWRIYSFFDELSASLVVNGFLDPIPMFCICVCVVGEGLPHTNEQFLDISRVSENPMHVDTIYQETASDSAGKGFSTQATLHFRWLLLTSDMCSWLIGYRSEVPRTLSLGSVNFLEWFTELRKPVYSLDHRFVNRGHERIRINSKMKRCIG